MKSSFCSGGVSVLFTASTNCKRDLQARPCSSSFPRLWPDLRIMLKPFLLCVIVAMNIRSSVADIPTNWTDCGMPNATLHWVNVTSTPNPLHTGEQQTVTKSGYTDKVYTNVTVEYQQFWLLGKHWFKFLDFKTDACAEHPVICNTKPGQIFTESALHPKLNKLTPHGMYRSRQVYWDVLSGEQIGCVDLKVPYVK